MDGIHIPAALWDRFRAMDREADLTIRREGTRGSRRWIVSLRHRFGGKTISASGALLAALQNAAEEAEGWGWGRVPDGPRAPGASDAPRA